MTEAGQVSDHESTPGHTLTLSPVSIHKHVYIRSSKCLCAADSLHAKHGWFSSFWGESLSGPASDNGGSGFPRLSSLTLLSSQIRRGDQTRFCRRPVWSGDDSEAGAGPLQSRHHIQGTHGYKRMLIGVLKSLFWFCRSNRTCEKELL